MFRAVLVSLLLAGCATAPVTEPVPVTPEVLTFETDWRAAAGRLTILSGQYQAIPGPPIKHRPRARMTPEANFKRLLNMAATQLYEARRDFDGGYQELAVTKIPVAHLHMNDAEEIKNAKAGQR